MGSKGSNTTTTTQNQTYTPTGGSYITNALDRATSAANQPFAIPQAPVAGFSQDQLRAFQNVNNAQGMEQPYISQAQGYFSPQGAQAFYNPMAANVMAGLQDIFGQQATQNTGNLVQAAGGVGADRVAVGQSELARQQGLSAGQTLAGLWNNAAQQAQSAGYGVAGLGAQAQNAALQGAQAQLGTGGLQQQLAQAQLNSPYQQQLAQAAFPYQQAQFLAGITGSLAPGLGGTSYGTGTQTSPAPSLFSQILGGGLAGAGIVGQTGGFGSNGWLTGNNGVFGKGGGGSLDSGSWGANNPGVAGSAYYGPASPYAEGGEVSDKPINVDQFSYIPQTKTPSIAPVMPHLDLSPHGGGSSGGGKGGGAGDLISSGLKLAAMFDTGGSVNPFAGPKGGIENPFGGATFKHRFPQGYADGGSPFDEPFRMPDRESVEAWRRGVDADRAGGMTEQTMSGLPNVITQAGGLPKQALAFAGTGADKYDPAGFAAEAKTMEAAKPTEAKPFPNIPYDEKNPYDPEYFRQTAEALTPPINPVPLPQARPAEADATTPPEATATEGQLAPQVPAAPRREKSFIDSPWAALTAAGLGIMGGTSPFAGVNIGQGGMQGLKMLEQQRDTELKQQTADQAAQRLAQEAKFHEDSYTRMTPGQKAQIGLARERFDFERKKPIQIGKNLFGQPVMAQMDEKGNFVQPGTNKPIDLSQIGEMDEQMIESMAKQIATYTQAPISAYKATTPVGIAIANRVQQLNPQYDAKFYHEAQVTRDKFAAGPQADTIRSFNVAYGHIEVAKQLAEALNAGDVRTAQRLGNWLKTELNLSSAPGNLQAANQIVGDEIMKAVIGARGALGDREEVKKNLDAAKAKGQLMDLYNQVYQPLMLEQLGGFKREFEAGTHGAKDFGDKLSPEVRAALEGHEKRHEAARQGAGAPAANQAEAITQAKDAIAKGAPRDAVIKRMKDAGFDTTGL